MLNEDAESGILQSHLPVLRRKTMAMSAKEFLGLDEQKLYNLAHLTRCVRCGVYLQENRTGNRKTANGDVCSDCYFQAIGEELDRHPISVPRMRRGF